jgi:hypothetical protein
LALVLCLSAGACHAQAQADTTLKVGIATVDITPEGPVFMAGFSGRKKPSEGVYKELTASCVVFDNGETRMGIMAIDVLKIGMEHVEAVREVAQKFDIPPEQMMLNPQHTHCGPHLWHKQTIESGYTQVFMEKICGLIEPAVADLQPATLDFTIGSSSMAVNRRQLNAEGKCIGMRPEPRGSIDMDVPVLRVLTPEGKVRVVIFGYACHPTTMSGYLIGPDFPGYARDWIAAAYPDCLPMYLQGCAGDIKPRYVRLRAPYTDANKPPGSFGYVLLEEPLDTVKEIGHELGRAVVCATCVPCRPLEPVLRGVHEFALLPLKKPEPTRDAHETEVQVLRIGDLYIIGMNGEVCVDIGLRIKRELSDLTTWVNGYTNRRLGYIVAAKQMPEEGYEVRCSPFDERAEDVLVAKAVELARRAAGK